MRLSLWSHDSWDLSGVTISQRVIILTTTDAPSISSSVGWDLLDETESVIAWFMRLIRCRNLAAGHNFDHYRCPILLLFSKSLVRKERMDPIFRVAFPTIFGREEGNGLSFLSRVSSCRYRTKKKSWRVYFLSWLFIWRYRTKSESQGIAGGSLHIFAHLMLLSCLPNCRAVSPIGMRDMLAAAVWRRWDMHNGLDFQLKVKK